LGRNFNFEIAVVTVDLDFEDTLQLPFMTRDTVAVETPASLATSLIVDGLTPFSVSAFFIVPFNPTRVN